jgi:hypothetical protein
MGVAIHDWNRKRGKLLTLVLAVVTPTVLSGPARADAPTHRFQIGFAKTNYKADCGADGCTVACEMKGRLTNLTASLSPQIDVIFRYKHPRIPDQGPEGTTLGFQFEPLESRKTGDSLVTALGVTCRQLVTRSVQVSCTSAQGDACSGFVNVRIDERKSPRIKAQTVSN